MKASTLSPPATTVIYIWLGCWPTYKSRPTADKHVNSLNHLFRIREFKEWFNTVKPGPFKSPVARNWGSLNVDAIEGIPFSFQGYFLQWPESGLISKWNKEDFVHLTGLTSHYPVTGLLHPSDIGPANSLLWEVSCVLLTFGSILSFGALGASNNLFSPPTPQNANRMCVHTLPNPPGKQSYLPLRRIEDLCHS